MTHAIEQQLAALRKDVTGLTEINADLKDKIIDQEEELESLRQHISQTSKEFRQERKQPKGLSAHAMKLIRSVENRIGKMEDKLFLDQQVIENSANAVRQLTRELTQTVAAND